MGAIRIEDRGRVRGIVLSRPAEMNAINSELIAGLEKAISELATDRRLGAAVITAEGETFCAGADLREARELTTDAAAFGGWLSAWRRTFDLVADVEKPVIAAVEGLAVAGGLEMILACDFVLASERARFGDAHINYGLVPGGGGSQRLPDAVGTRLARWMMFTGEIVDARRALEIGLVQQVLPADRFKHETETLMDKIVSRSGPALAFMKRMTESAGVSERGLDLELEGAASVVTGPDAQEGIAAFVEKRAPSFPTLVDRG